MSAEPKPGEWFDPDDAPRQSSGWALVGLAVVLAIGALGWAAVAYAALWAWSNPAKAAGGVLAVLGSVLIFVALARMEREDDARRGRRP